ncbi:MAG TPA: PTS sugar transporter subunit IIA [Parachlamydiaceae bacterium]|nr:PTS sugar transporter subunit IIA [Parachlamydiaceae bacterium]
MLKIFNYLNKDLIVFLEASSRDDALKRLIEKVYEKGAIKDKELFFNALVERERIISTGIGMGVAIPHAKINGYDNFFIAIGILQKGIEWNSLDGSLARLIFMVGGPDDKQTEYLQILSSLTMAIKDEERRKKMLTGNSAEAIIELFKAF